MLSTGTATVSRGRKAAAVPLSRLLPLVLLLTLARAAEPPRRGLAILSSLALPGTGQMLLGTSGRGEAQLWLDGAIWATWGGLTWLGSNREGDARVIAGRESGGDMSITKASYFRALERYDNADEYNEDVRREARSRYPDDPEAQHSYFERNGYFGEQAWNWSSDSARFQYWRTRKSARSAVLAAGFAAGGLLVNRLLGALDCAFFVKEPGGHSRFEFGTGDGLTSVEVRYRF